MKIPWTSPWNPRFSTKVTRCLSRPERFRHSGQERDSGQGGQGCRDVGFLNFPQGWRCGYGSIPIIPFLLGWTSIYQLFWCSPGLHGFDPSPCHWTIEIIVIKGLILWKSVGQLCYKCFFIFWKSVNCFEPYGSMFFCPIFFHSWDWNP
jgi:hypothetical protein